MSSKTPRGRYTAQKGHAKKRNIPFELTFEEWWSIWRESGHWEERGRRSGQYVMARHGDTGPYAVGNVSIIKHTENSGEWVRDKEFGAKIGASNRKRGKLSEEAKARIGAANRRHQLARYGKECHD